MTGNLGRTFALEREISRLETQYSYFMDMACGGTSRIGAVRYGGTARHSRLEHYIILADETREALNQAIDALVDEERKILTIALGLSRYEFYLIVYMREILRLSWRAIARRLGLSTRTVRRYHAAAALELREL